MNQIEKFKEIINKYLDGWQSIDIRSVSFPAYNKWISLATRIILSEKSTRHAISSETFPDCDHIKILREIRNISDLDDILRQIESGILTVTRQEIHLGRIEGNEIKNNLGFSFHVQRKHYHWLNPQPEVPSLITLYATGDQIHNVLHHGPDAIGSDELDWELRSLKIPYDGLNDLLGSFLDIPRQHSRSRVIESTVVYINAPIKLRFLDTSTLSKGKFSILVESIGYKKLNDVTVGIVGSTDAGTIYRGSHEFSARDWKPDDKCTVACKEVNVKDLTSASLFLSFRGNVIDNIILHDESALLQNPRILAYSHFDKNIEKLKAYLIGKGKEPSNDFEKGVALLLHLCGFNSALYGQLGGIQEEIDIIAFVPNSNDVIAVECTIKDLDANGKMTKFSRRIKELPDELNDYNLLPLLFTALERKNISPTELDSARTERIGVAAAEDIQELLTMAVAQKGIEEIMVYLRGLLPESGPDWLFRTQY